MSGRGLICAEPDDICELCGKVDELRPYGPGGKRVCFDCGMKDQEQAKARLHNYIFGSPLPPEYDTPEGRAYPTRDEAIAAWNRRALPPEVREVVEAARDCSYAFSIAVASYGQWVLGRGNGRRLEFMETAIEDFERLDAALARYDAAQEKD